MEFLAPLLSVDALFCDLDRDTQTYISFLRKVAFLQKSLDMRDLALIAGEELLFMTCIFSHIELSLGLRRSLLDVSLFFHPEFFFSP